VWERDTGVKLSRTVAAADRGPFDVVEQTLGEVARGDRVLEALLVLDANRVQAEVVGDAQGGGVHLELAEQLGLGQFGGLVGAEVERHPGVLQPGVDALGLVVADGLHLGDQGTLRQALLVDAERVDELVIEDGVVHPHTSLVEDAEDGLLPLELVCERCAELPLGAVVECRQIADVALVMDDHAVGQPCLEAVERPRVGEVLAPQGGVPDAGLGHAAGETEEPDEARELAFPVGDYENPAAVAAQSGEDMMAVLPDSLGDDERSLRRKMLKISMPARWLSMKP